MTILYYKTDILQYKYLTIADKKFTHIKNDWVLPCLVTFCDIVSHCEIVYLKYHIDSYITLQDHSVQRYKYYWGMWCVLCSTDTEIDYILIINLFSLGDCLQWRVMHENNLTFHHIFYYLQRKSAYVFIYSF